MEPKKSVTEPSSDMKAFQELFKKSKHVVVITGAGISDDSLGTTFRGETSSWKGIEPKTLSSNDTFTTNPTLIWEYYSYLRELVRKKVPNLAHSALAEAEERFKRENKIFCVVTKNIDDLQRRAGTKNLFEIHGSLFKTLCPKCKNIEQNMESPICSFFEDNNSSSSPEPVPEVTDLKQLPTCNKPNCNTLLRPNIVLFGEFSVVSTFYMVKAELGKCDLFLIIGTLNSAEPVRSFCERVIAKNVPIAEFNTKKNKGSDKFQYFFAGDCVTRLLEALSVT